MRCSDIVHLPPMLYRHLCNYFGGGPDIVRWASICNGVPPLYSTWASSEKPHIPVKCTTKVGSRNGVARTSTIYVPVTDMRVKDFEVAACWALGLQETGHVVATDSRSVTYSDSPQHTLYEAGHRVRSHKGACFDIANDNRPGRLSCYGQQPGPI